MINDVFLLLGKVATNPQFENVFQFIRIFAQYTLRFLGIILVEGVNDRFQVHYTHKVVLARDILVAVPRDGHSRRAVCRTAHLVDIPVGLQVAQVAHAYILTHTLCVLVIPQGEGVVVTIGKDNRRRALLQGVEVVLSEVTAGIAAAAVVVVPVLRSHLHGHQHARHADHRGHHGIVKLDAAQPVDDGGHTHAHPYGEGIERTGVSIVTLAGLRGHLVEVNHDGDARHEEQEEHHPELLAALAAAESLPEETQQSQQQRQGIIDIVTLVCFQVVGQLALVAQTGIVDKRNTCNPVAVLGLAHALDVILASAEVPHEVAPVHEAQLIGGEETEIVNLSRNLQLLHLAVARVVIYNIIMQLTQPRLILRSLAAVPDAREQHILSIDIVSLATHLLVNIRLVGRPLLLALVDVLTLRALRNKAVGVLGVGLPLQLRVEGRAVEQRLLAILVTGQIVTDGKDVLGRVLVHRRIGGRANHNQRIAGVANHHHQEAKQSGIEHTAQVSVGGNLPISKQHIEQGRDKHHANHDAHGTAAKERNTKHNHRGNKHPLGSLQVLVPETEPDGIGHHANQKDKIDNKTRVERHTQHIDEQQFKPAADLHDARHYAVENDAYQHKTEQQSPQRALHGSIGIAAIVVNQHHGGDTEQIEQVDADRQTHQIGNQHQPAVGTGLVGVVLPLQYQPEYQRSEERRESIHLTLNSAEPERIAEGINQRTYHARTKDSYHLHSRLDLALLTDEATQQMGDSPEQEQYATSAEQGRHRVDHHSHLRYIGGKLTKQVSHQHEERRTRRVTNLQAIACRYKLRTVPEAGCRLNGRAVNHRCHGKHQPTENIIQKVVFLHSITIFRI